VALGISRKFIWPDVFDGSLIYDTWRDVACGHEVAQPLRSKRINLVIKNTHLSSKQLVSHHQINSLCRARKSS
jgi:hypothetical protein